MIAAQIVLSVIPGVEIVTVFFVSYSFVVGWKKGMLAATAFSLLRQAIFGFFPAVLILYLVYYNLLTLSFGLLHMMIKEPIKALPLIVLIACFGTVIGASNKGVYSCLVALYVAASNLYSNICFVSVCAVMESL